MLFFTRSKVEKNLKEILQKVKIDDLSAAKSLIEADILLKINFKDDHTSILFNADNLKIGKKEIAEIEKRIHQKIAEENWSGKINILFTASNLQESPNLKSPEPKKEIEFALPNIKKIIAIASGKGGVGKSTLATNIAISLKKIGYNVGLADADIYGPSIAHMMNLKEKPQSENNLIIPPQNYGIYCMSIGLLVDANQALAWRGPMVSKSLNQLIKGVAWPELDYLIIDFPPGTGDVHISLATLAPIAGAVIISTPGEVALLDAIRAIDMFKKVKIPILGIVENMSYLTDNSGNKNYIFGKEGAKNLAKKLNINFLGEIELDEKIRAAGDEGNPITNLEPSSKLSFAYGQIAENIIDQITKLSERYTKL